MGTLREILRCAQEGKPNLILVPKSASDYQRSQNSLEPAKFEWYGYLSNGIKKMRPAESIALWADHNMLIDAHTHMDKYEDELELALDEINQHRIFTISNSMDLPSYQRNLAIAERCDWVLPTFGIHPWRAPHYVDRLPELTEAIRETPILGEIGLDYRFVKDASQYPAQREVFHFFLAAAHEQNKIVNLHTSGAEPEILHLLKQYDIQRSIIHWYAGSLDLIEPLVEQGAFFTIGVELFHSEHIQKIAEAVPLERLLTETDNPGGEEWLTGILGMPVLVTKVIQGLAKLRNMTVEMMSQTIEKNFLQLIQNDPWLLETYRRVLSISH